MPPTVSVATKWDLVGEVVGLAVGPSVGLIVGPSVGRVVGPSVGLAVGPSVGLVVGPSVGSRVGAHVESSEPWYMVSLCLPIATGFVLFHAGRTSKHMGVLRNTASGTAPLDARACNITAQSKHRVRGTLAAQV